MLLFGAVQHRRPERRDISSHRDAGVKVLQGFMEAGATFITQFNI